jgi:hypothetical protein
MSSEVFSHGWGEKKNNRKFPGIKGKRPDHKSARKAMADANAAKYAALPLAEKILRNPQKFADV